MEDDLYDELPDKKGAGGLCIGPRTLPPPQQAHLPSTPPRLCFPAFNLFGFLLAGGCAGLSPDAQDAANRFGI
jgi:hypothetical protein